MNRTRRYFLSLPATAAILLAGVQARALTLTMSPSYTADKYTLSWAAVTDPSSATATISYRILSTSTYNNPLPGPASTTTVTGALTVEISTDPGPRCFIAYASSTFSGIIEYAGSRVCHPFLHSSAKSNTEGPAKVDGAGGTTGVSSWDLTYFLDRDAVVSIKVYPPGTTFGTDPYGFPFPIQTVVTRTLVNSETKVGEGIVGSEFNTVTWNMTDDGGAIVAKGMYYAVIEASSTVHNPQLRYRGFTTLPVSTLPVAPKPDPKAFNDSIIMAPSPARSGTSGTIGFRLQKPSNVTIEIFTLEGKRVFHRTQAYATGAQNMAWNGTTNSGTGLATGVYLLRISANDGETTLVNTKKIMVMK